MTERELTAADLDALLALQRATYAGLARREFLVQTEPEELVYIFGGGGAGR